MLVPSVKCQLKVAFSYFIQNFSKFREKHNFGSAYYKQKIWIHGRASSIPYFWQHCLSCHTKHDEVDVNKLKASLIPLFDREHTCKKKGGHYASAPSS